MYIPLIMFPVLIMVIAFIVAYFMSSDDSCGGGGFSTFGNPFVPIFYYGAAIIVSLTAWLIWALIT